MTVDVPADLSYTADERAAMRAFLQRCEVRLSTMHRVATALLSGAGILVLALAGRPQADATTDAVLGADASLGAGAGGCRPRVTTRPG